MSGSSTESMPSPVLECVVNTQNVAIIPRNLSISDSSTETPTPEQTNKYKVEIEQSSNNPSLNHNTDPRLNNTPNNTPIDPRLSFQFENSAPKVPITPPIILPLPCG
eukprot:UN03085